MLQCNVMNVPIPVPPNISLSSFSLVFVACFSSIELVRLLPKMCALEMDLLAHSDRFIAGSVLNISFEYKKASLSCLYFRAVR